MEKKTDPMSSWGSEISRSEFKVSDSLWVGRCLVGGFNPSETYLSKWESSPNRDEHNKYSETTTQMRISCWDSGCFQEISSSL